MRSSRRRLPWCRRALHAALEIALLVAGAAFGAAPVRAAPPPADRLAEAAAGRVEPAGLGGRSGEFVGSVEDVRVWLERTLIERGWRPGIDAFEVIDERRVRGMRHVRLRQTWNGTPVECGSVSVRIDAAGRPVALGGFVPGVNPDPRLAAEPFVRAAALEAAGLDGRRWSTHAERWVVRRAGRDRLAWCVRLGGEPGEAERRAWFVGEAAAPERVESDLVPASALVYPDDGRQPLREVVLENLLGDGSRLRGRNVRAERHAAAPVLAPGGDFRVVPTEPDTTHFDEANVYWVCDRYVETFLRPLGFQGFDSLLVIRVQDASLWPLYVAGTTPGYTLLGPAIEYFVNDPAKGRDLVTHEIQHAVTYELGVHPEGPRGEAAALHEGISDYFACASTDDPSMGEWVYFRFPHGATRVDAPASEFRYSRYDSVQFGPNLPRSVWANGMILSGALWDLRRDIGPAADSLVLEALSYLPYSFTWADFANALLVADLDHHQVRWSAAVLRALLGREIRGFVPAAILGPTDGQPNQPLQYAATNAWAEHVAAFEWWVLRDCRGAACPEGWQLAAAGPEATITRDVDYRLRLVVSSAWGTSDTTERFVSVVHPQARIVGPPRITQRATGEWKVESIAATPVDVSWFRTWRRWGAVRTGLGSGPGVTFAADTAFLLEAQVQDRYFRRVQLQLAVGIEPPLPPGPSLASGSLQLAVTLPPPSGHGEVRFEVPFGGRSALRVYDVSGRVRRRLWDGPVSPGAHTLRWSAADLEPGVYVMGLETPRGRLVRKFAVLR